MTAPVVCDASTVIAALVDAGDDGRWAAARLTAAELYAPTILPFECANVLRRLERAGIVTPDQASQALIDLLDLPVEYWPYPALAQRIWRLRDNLSSYDAAYVALAEELGATLVTLDRGLIRGPGMLCTVEGP